jgi:hypothetical protein
MLLPLGGWSDAVIFEQRYPSSLREQATDMVLTIKLIAGRGWSPSIAHETLRV